MRFISLPRSALRPRYAGGAGYSSAGRGDAGARTLSCRSPSPPGREELSPGRTFHDEKELGTLLLRALPRRKHSITCTLTTHGATARQHGTRAGMRASAAMKPLAVNIDSAASPATGEGILPVYAAGGRVKQHGREEGLRALLMKRKVLCNSGDSCWAPPSPNCCTFTCASSLHSPPVCLLPFRCFLYSSCLCAY